MVSVPDISFQSFLPAPPSDTQWRGQLQSEDFLFPSDREELFRQQPCFPGEHIGWFPPRSVFSHCRNKWSKTSHFNAVFIYHREVLSVRSSGQAKRVSTWGITGSTKGWASWTLTWKRWRRTYSQARSGVGRDRFLAGAGWRSLSPCWLSARDCCSLLDAAHTLSHVAPSIFRQKHVSSSSCLKCF